MAARTLLFSGNEKSKFKIFGWNILPIASNQNLIMNIFLKNIDRYGIVMILIKNQ